MIVLANIILALVGIQLIVALVNVLFRQQYKHLPVTGEPRISVLIPARNEEGNLPALLQDLQMQSYTHLEVWVYDDMSSDRTAEVVRKGMHSDDRIQLIEGKELPEEWLGKNHACYQLAQRARGSYLLFIDADVRLEPDALQKSLAFVRKYHLQLLSVFPYQKMYSHAEWSGVPIMNHILLSLLPLPLVMHSHKPALAAANGQFMFYEAGAYRDLEPHRELKKKKVEDIESIRLLKRNKKRVACLTGDRNISCRMYSRPNAIIEGFSKNFVAYFGGSNVLAMAYVLLMVFGIIPPAIAFGTKGILLYLAGVLTTRLFTSVLSHQDPFKNLLYYPAQLFMMLVILQRSMYNQYKKKFQWKGRNIS